ncbi:MAG: hypothetical protein KY460_03455 [Actinobacteria bacterium]|nr:hypothetical protein [Actinomycetota bacterium]
MAGRPSPEAVTFLLTDIEGNDERAAVLLGAADATLARLGVGREHVDRVEHARTSAALRAALGHDRCDTLAARGAAMSLTEAVSVALSGGDVRAPDASDAAR